MNPKRVFNKIERSKKSTYRSRKNRLIVVGKIDFKGSEKPTSRGRKIRLIVVEKSELQRSEKSTPPSSKPIGGISTSSTRLLTIVPNDKYPQTYNQSLFVKSLDQSIQVYHCSLVLLGHQRQWLALFHGCF